MSLVTKKFIDLDYNSPNSLTASDIPFNSSQSIYDKVNDLYYNTFKHIPLYVDAENGNDETADGTINKPYRTIKAAIDSHVQSFTIPEPPTNRRNIYHIILFDNQVHLVNETINSCYRAVVTLVGKTYYESYYGGWGDYGNDTRPIIRFIDFVDNGTRKLAGFSAPRHLAIFGCHVEIQNVVDSSLSKVVFYESIMSCPRECVSNFLFCRGTIYNPTDYFIVTG